MELTFPARSHSRVLQLGKAQIIPAQVPEDADHNDKFLLQAHHALLEACATCICMHF